MATIKTGPNRTASFPPQWVPQIEELAIERGYKHVTRLMAAAGSYAVAHQLQFTDEEHAAVEAAVGSYGPSTAGNMGFSTLPHYGAGVATLGVGGFQRGIQLIARQMLVGSLSLWNCRTPEGIPIEYRRGGIAAPTPITSHCGRPPKHFRRGRVGTPSSLR